VVLFEHLVPVAAADSTRRTRGVSDQPAVVAATPFFGAEIKGARRWLVIFRHQRAASEFLKPAFVILIAWLFGESTKRPEMPAKYRGLGAAC